MKGVPGDEHSNMLQIVSLSVQLGPELQNLLDFLLHFFVMGLLLVEVPHELCQDLSLVLVIRVVKCHLRAHGFTAVLLPILTQDCITLPHGNNWVVDFW